MFVICGEALFDVFIDETIAVDAREVPFSGLVGGSPFNVAVGLARLGQQSALLTGISRDLLGDRLMAVLKSEKVITNLVSRKSAPTTLSFVQKNKDGVPDYVFYGEGAADRLLHEEDIAFDLDGVECLHFGSYSIVVPPTADTLYQLAQKESGKRIISLDPNIRPTVESDLDLWRDRVEKMVALSDVVKLSDEDMTLLYPGQNPGTILAGWLDRGVKLAIMTRGGEGATLMSHIANIETEAMKTTVVDTVGAGDTFQTIVLDELVALNARFPGEWQNQLDGMTLSAIGKRAGVAAAITCSRAGANLPGRTEIEQALSE